MAKKIAIALSGGVDSSVAAYLLKQTGVDLTAVFMRFYARDSAEITKINAEEKRAEAVAKKLNIRWQVLDYSQTQKDLVVDNFIQAYAKGESPNPCISCNQLLKFGKLLDWTKNQDFDYLATGHYVQIIQDSETLHLAAGVDQKKDQSYFLYQLQEQQLKHLLFPLGELKKTQVKAIAKKLNLISKEEKESFDVCFLHNTKLKQFLSNNIKTTPGNIIDQKGLIVGKHQGLAFYTIGQRQGFEIDHQALKKSQVIQYQAQQPPALYVIAKNIKTQELMVGEKAACFNNHFSVKNLNFVNQAKENDFLKKKKLYALVKVRNTGRLINCQLTLEKEVIEVLSQEKIFALAKGQAAVFYQKKAENLLLIAGATIGTTLEQI